ncbi:hypothetical protein D3C87_2077470 [compost metagenome]
MTLIHPPLLAPHPSAAISAAQLSRVVDLRMILIECLSVGLRVTLIALRVTVSMVIFQKPLLGTVIFAGNVSKAPPW